MSLLKEIEDRGAVVEWSPSSTRLAVGTKDSAGSGFDDYGGELELYAADVANAETMAMAPQGKVKARCVCLRRSQTVPPSCPLARPCATSHFLPTHFSQHTQQQTTQNETQLTFFFIGLVRYDGARA
jgi:hypothetical protein